MYPQRLALRVLVVVMSSGFAAAGAQQPTPAQQPTTTTTTTTTLAAANPQSSVQARLNMYVFPNKGQTANQQRLDESQCYDWAKTQTNFDPIATPPPSQAANYPQSTGHENAPARSGARGAAVGAVGGAIGGNAGKGAAIGAAVGVLKGAHDRRQAADQQAGQQQADANAYAQAQQQYNAATGDFRRAFGACLQAKNYTVK